MDKRALAEFITSLKEFEAPAVQNELGATYGEVKEVLDGLIKAGRVEYLSGVTYKVREGAKGTAPKPLYTPHDEEERKFILALWECLKYGVASTSFLQRRMKMSYYEAGKAADWMKKHRFAAPFGEIIISKEDFIETFGNPDEELQGEYSLYGRVRNETLFDDEGESERRTLEDVDFDAMEERLRTFLQEETPQDSTDDEDDDDDEEGEEIAIESNEKIDLKEIVSQCLQECLQNGEDDETFFIVDENGDPVFKISFVRDGEAMRLSDRGETVKNSAQTVRKIKNVLKGFPSAQLDENGEIYVEIEKCLSVLTGLMTLYAAVDAVKKMK